MGNRIKALAPGDRVGVYEVVAALGAGGMGEVYRANDTSLGRQVALKVLPEAFAGDRHRLGRFEREARILASLNHVNIAAIHGLEQSGSTPALVLELVEGPTLEEHLAAGPLSLDDTLNYSQQIAEALEAAHEQGVVHRDLKPANVKIRPDGTVKVLDFGIAKILEEKASRSDEVQSSTLTAIGPGVLIGTTAYMSPEQARGEDVTRRSDVWAFGAIVFEMLTGKRAFTGATRSDVLAAILSAAPEWSALPPTTPPAITRLVRRCLARDPKARLHDIGDARLDIEEIQRTLHTELPPQPSAMARGPLLRRAAFGLAAVVALTVVAVAIYVIATGRDSEPLHEVRLQMPPPPGTYFVSVPAMSPDGRTIAFVAASDHGGPGRMWIRPLAAAAATAVPNSEGAIFPFWSWDSRSVAFFADRTLKRVPVSGGNPVAVCAAEAGRGGVWLDDDTIVFAPGPFSPLMRVSASGGKPEAFTTLAADDTGHRFPQRLLERYLSYYSVNRTPDQSGTRIISINAPDRSLNVIPSLRDAHYVKGFLVFVRPGNTRTTATDIESTYDRVLAQSLELPDGPLTGEPVEIGRTRISEVLGRYVVATAPTGVVAMLGPIEGVGQLTWMSRDGRVLETVGAPASQLGVELSPDGREVATMRSDGIWTMNLARPVPNRVTSGAHPIWSPDGMRILSLFQGRGGGTFDLVATTVTTLGAESVVETGPAPARTTGVLKPIGWLRQGTIVWVNGSSNSLWAMPVAGPRQAAELLDDGAVKPEARLSPDGRWIAYATNRSGRFEVEVRTFPTTGPAHPVSTQGGGYPRWRADGRELYFVSATSRIMAVAFAPGTPPTIGKPEELFEVQVPVHPNRFQFAGYGYDASPDGSRFLVNRMVSRPETSMSIIVNWRPPR